MPRPRSSVHRSAKMVGILRDLLESLPTAQQRREASDSLDAVIKFLQEVRDRLDAVPTSEDSQYLASAIARLDSLFSEAQSNPVLARAIGLEKAKPSSPKAPTRPDTVRIEAILGELKDLTIDQMRERFLSHDRYGLADLRAVASHLGGTVNSRSTRQALAAQIVTKLANIRGYRALSTPTDEPDQQA